MSYIQNNLMKGEKLLYRSHLHWVEFLPPIICLLLAIIFVGFGNSTAGGALFVVIAAITGIASYITFKTSEFGVTNKRVIVKVGVIRRNSLEVLLNKIEAIQVNQGIWGRILGFGSITVSGTGGTKDPFHKIDAPFEFRKQVLEQIATAQDAK